MNGHHEEQVQVSPGHAQRAPGASIKEKTYEEAELASRAMDAAAIEKAQCSPGWQPYRYEQAAGGLIITGCLTRPKKSGPNKGEPKFLINEENTTVVVTREDIDRHKQRLRALDSMEVYA